MRINPGETYESWAKRVQQYEYGYALQQVAKGEDLNLVMEAMTARIQQKLLHPVFRALRASPEDTYDPIAAKLAYEKAYTNSGGVADHVVDDSDHLDQLGDTKD
jgi:hypothetical protein